MDIYVCLVLIWKINMKFYMRETVSYCVLSLKILTIWGAYSHKYPNAIFAARDGEVVLASAEVITPVSQPDVAGQMQGNLEPQR